MLQELAKGCSLVRLDIKGDERGSLIAVEGQRNLPFPIARIYYVFDTLAGVSRGFHAHRKLHQLVMAVHGSCTMTVDDGVRRADVLLDSPGQGLMMEPMVWHEMHDFSPGCVLLVVADLPYDEADYIRDYERFLAEVRAAA